MGKGEIARYEQFLLSPQCFQKACFPGASKGVIVWEWVKSMHFEAVSRAKLKISQTMRHLSVTGKKALWGKKEKVLEQHFLISQHRFHVLNFLNWNCFVIGSTFLLLIFEG